MMALGKFMTAVLLYAAAAYGNYFYGGLEISNEDVSVSSRSMISSAAKMNIVGDVFSQGSKAKFVGLNICGFDFGW